MMSGGKSRVGQRAYHFARLASYIFITHSERMGSISSRLVACKRALDFREARLAATVHVTKADPAGQGRKAASSPLVEYLFPAFNSGMDVALLNMCASAHIITGRGEKLRVTERTLWDKTSHERTVENFYGVGVENYENFHDGYLNFGLWDGGVKNFVEAAERLIRRLGEMSGLGPQSRLLDVACGMGTQDIFLQKTFSPESIDGLDVTWKHIEHGRRRAAEAGFSDRIQFHHGTATQLPFADESFTNVLSVEGPIHFDTREKFIREAHRVLVPGGVFVLSDYTLKRPPRTAFERFVVWSARKLWKVPRENAVSASEYRATLERAGFTGVSIEEIGADVIPGYYFEQRRPETIRELTEIRGFVGGRLGGIIDLTVYKAYTMGLLDYVLVRAVKP